MLLRKYCFSIKSCTKCCIVGTFICVITFVVREATTGNVRYPDNRDYSFSNCCIVAPNYINGTRILHKDVAKYWNEPLKKWDPSSQILAFVHIGKAGGTSLDDALRNSVLPAARCTMTCVQHLTDLGRRNRNCPWIFPIICNKHFDWTLIEKGEGMGYNMAPIILFRDPIKRVVSHFHFAKKLEWTKGLKIKQRNLSQYLNDSDSMMETHDIWVDGQVSLHLPVTQKKKPHLSRNAQHKNVVNSRTPTLRGADASIKVRVLQLANTDMQLLHLSQFLMCRPITTNLIIFNFGCINFTTVSHVIE